MIKRSLVVLLVAVFALLLVPSIALGVTPIPETVAAHEQMLFSPLLYTTVLLGAVLLCSVVVSIVFYVKYQAQKENVCHNLSCLNNPSALKERNSADWFDYSQFETPKEFSESCTSQSEMVMEEVIKHLIADAPPVPTRPALPIVRDYTPAYGGREDNRMYKPVGRYQRLRDTSEPLPHISVVPEAKHANRFYRSTLETKKASVRVDVPIELDILLRKIS